MLDEFVEYSRDLNKYFSGNYNFFRILEEYKSFININITDVLKNGLSIFFEKIIRLIDNLFLNKNKLIRYSKNTKNMLFNPFPFLTSNKDFNEFYLICEYLYKPEFSCNRNFFHDVISNDSFKTLLKHIFHSNCLNSYYNTYENEDNFFKSNEENLFNNFIEGINYCPLPEYIKGYTDCSLLIFINSQPRKFCYSFNKENLKILVIFFIKNSSKWQF